MGVGSPSTPPDLINLLVFAVDRKASYDVIFGLNRKEELPEKRTLTVENDRNTK